MRSALIGVCAALAGFSPPLARVVPVTGGVPQFIDATTRLFIGLAGMYP
jgi:hypothetical protein